MLPILRSFALFLTAGLLEIGGGYLIWLWLREGRSGWLGLFGGLSLFAYGIVPIFQPARGGKAGQAMPGANLLELLFETSRIKGWIDSDLPRAVARQKRQNQEAPAGAAHTPLYGSRCRGLPASKATPPCSSLPPRQAEKEEDIASRICPLPFDLPARYL